MNRTSTKGAEPPPVITVDGPSGVGKGTVTRWLSTELGWHRLDSGALYRILALAAQKAGIDLADIDAIAALAPGLDIRFSGDSEANEKIEVDGEDWTARVRAETTGGLASRIAAEPKIRAALLQRQYDFRRSPGLIADGRDMGTVVFPDAGLKIFLDASADARAQRRWLQLRAAGTDVTLEDLLSDVRARDERDRGRQAAPLKPAPDAVVIDNTELSPSAVLEKIGGLIANRQWTRHME